MRILITGAAGMLGSALIPALLDAGHQVVATDIELTSPRPWGVTGPRLGYLDVRNSQEVQSAVEVLRPDLIAHLAAETDLELCESDPDHAYLTNTVATKHVALACQARDIPMVYISTAGVFDGEKEGPYDEFDTPAPINLYGASKYQGELVVRSLVTKHFIVRAGWMVGGGQKDHKFVARIVNQLSDGATTLHAVADKFGTPTYAPDFSRCLTELIASGSYGLYHLACEGEGTRYDVAAEILHTLGRDDVELVAVGSDHFAEEFWAPRPPSEMMRNRVLDLQGMNRMRPWRLALQEYLLEAFADLAVDRTITVPDMAEAPTDEVLLRETAGWTSS